MLRLALTFVLAAQVASAQDMPTFASFHSASEALLSDPHDLTFGPDGNLYIADKFANRVVVMDPETLEIISAIGDGFLAGAHDVSFGADGRLYVAATGLSIPPCKTRGAFCLYWCMSFDITVVINRFCRSPITVLIDFTLIITFSVHFVEF